MLQMRRSRPEKKIANYTSWSGGNNFREKLFIYPIDFWALEISLRVSIVSLKQIVTHKIAGIRQ